MSGTPKELKERMKEFVAELGQFAATAEETLSKIEADPENNKNLFEVFSERMFTIRGTAKQLGLEDIATIAGLAEEIALKAKDAQMRSQIRKCVGALWDAETTVKYLIAHYDDETSEEQDILVNRLNATLKALGGAREQMSPDEIDALFNQKK